MPIFEFRCSACGNLFEQLILGQPEASTVHCPKCEKSEVEKVLSVFSSGRGQTESSSAAPGGSCGSSASRFS